MRARVLTFPPFRLDLVDERLLRDGAEVKLRRKPFAILKYLAQHPNRLVTHRELIDAVWGKVALSESVLRTHVYEVRTALGDGVIETVIGRGYRFIAEIDSVDPLGEAKVARDAPVSSRLASALVGRKSELDALERHLQLALARKRQVVVLTGEPGIGKTALMDAVLERATEDGALVARGSCVEQFGSGEAYLPVLGALGAACRSSHGQTLTDVLGKHAPTWLLQMPGLVPDESLAALQQRAQGATQARMLRELADALEVSSESMPIVLALDDLQWADNSTTELLELLARRRGPARLLVIGTCRQTDLANADALSKLLGELVGHREAVTLALSPLTANSVGDYLETRWPDLRSLALAEAIHEASNGNPLFMVALLEDVEARQMARVVDGKWQLLASLDELRALRPGGVTQLIEVQIGRLDATDQRILKTAAAAGAEFAAGAVAHALEMPAEEVDARCEEMAERGRFLRYRGIETWPDGTVQTRYAFVHALYQYAANARNPLAISRGWRRRIAERLEAGYGDDAVTIAAELAAHFDAAHDFARAVRYYELAGLRAENKKAAVEALAHFERARELLVRLPDTTDRDRIELHLLRALGRTTFAVDPLESTQLVPVLTRTADLARRLGDDQSLASALIGLQQSRMMHGLLREVDAKRGELEEIAARNGDPSIAGWSAVISGAAMLQRGRLEEARAALALERKRMLESSSGEPTSFPHAPLALSNASTAEWLLGRPDAALAAVRESVVLAETLGDPFVSALARAAAAAVHMWRGEWNDAAEHARLGARVATDARSALGCVWNTCVLQRAAVELGETSADAAFLELERLANPRAPIAGFGPSHHVLAIVEVAARAKRVGRALDVIASALAFADEHDQRAWEPELHRLRGELLQWTDRTSAEQCFLDAIALSRRQSSRSLELRAAMSLHRFTSGERKREWLEVVRTLLASFEQGLTTADLVDAKTLVNSGI